MTLGRSSANTGNQPGLLSGSCGTGKRGRQGRGAVGEGTPTLSFIPVTHRPTSSSGSPLRHLPSKTERTELTECLVGRTEAGRDVQTWGPTVLLCKGGLQAQSILVVQQPGLVKRTKRRRGLIGRQSTGLEGKRPTVPPVSGPPRAWCVLTRSLVPAGTADSLGQQEVLQASSRCESHPE